MVLNWKVNTITGSAAFLLTFFFSLSNNTWQTSILRAMIGFLIFFLISYILRFVVGQLSGKGPRNSSIQYSEQHLGETLESVQEKTIDEIIEEEQSFQHIPLGALHKGEERQS
ncbi:hypothetical protein QE429_003094 [Bacillus sp. SORGH_AS 510]|uniref:hypothetical protein n=1 Tax=Bacillus sp. SORGH_AS_0510 TaxID=3041771 RepID=UPI00277D7758|nr:hypothetical protein [Bacillus sp. SORGH_AS_0510]MDQ1146267.1 hypothetical protein [Bacillus sp. SORGH_AS_0510]